MSNLQLKPPQTCNQHIFRPELNASRDFADKQPDFAVSAVMVALHWMAGAMVIKLPQVMCWKLTRPF
jgi:hypothetical protein